MVSSEKQEKTYRLTGNAFIVRTEKTRWYAKRDMYMVKVRGDQLGGK